MLSRPQDFIFIWRFSNCIQVLNSNCSECSLDHIGLRKLQLTLAVHSLGSAPGEPREALTRRQRHNDQLQWCMRPGTGLEAVSDSTHL